MEVCVICGRPAECTHHLIFGRSRRRLANDDNLIIKLCNEHHNMAVKPVDRIHGNSTAEILSKMLGQALWERDFLMYFDEEKGEGARRAFVGRYGRSYL